jgi:putative aldouronate transport system substrate-binding protein
VTTILLLTAGLVFAGGGGQDTRRAGTATPSDNFISTGNRIVHEKITLTAFGNIAPTHAPWEEMYIFRRFEEMSNIHIAWTTVPTQGFRERLLLLMASGDYPDFWYRCNFTVADIITYGAQGIFVPLNEMIQQYGVNVRQRFSEHPDMEKAIIMPDGVVYSLPFVQPPPNAFNHLWMNRRWLENLGLNPPDTLAEFEAVLTAFQTRDPNRNGLNDEIPFSNQGGGGILNITSAVFGVGTLGNTQANAFIDMGPNNRIRLFAISDEFRSQLEWVAGLYARGLLDPEMVTQTGVEFTAKGEQNIIGSFTGNHNDQVGLRNREDFYPVVTAFRNNAGTRVYNARHLNIPQLGAFAMSNRNRYPLETMRWADFWYGEEGARLMWLGQEGVSYTRQPDGSYRFTDLILNNPDGLNQAQAIGRFLIGWSGGGAPVFAPLQLDRARGMEKNYEAYLMGTRYTSAVALPILTFTIAEQSELNPLISDIVTYIDEARIQFITGRRPLNQWDAYVRQVRAMGADRYVAIYQAAWDRWARN